MNLYGCDLAGQLINEVLLADGVAGRSDQSWVYDEAGNWVAAPDQGLWRSYDVDNELLSSSNASTVTVTGYSWNTGRVAFSSGLPRS